MVHHLIYFLKNEKKILCYFKYSRLTSWYQIKLLVEILLMFLLFAVELPQQQKNLNQFRSKHR